MKRTKKALCMLVLLAFVMFALPMTVFAASKPKITKQPVAAAVYNNGTATFKVTATGAKSYQWQYRTSTTGKWMNATATGNKTATLKVGATIERHGNQYRCAVKNATGTTYSNAVKLTVKFKTNPSNPTITAGKTQTFKVLTGCKAYQWQYRKTPTGTWMNATATGNKTATLKVPATVSKNGYQYRCKVTTKRGAIYSDASKLTVVKPTLGVTTQPADQFAKIGNTATFTVAGTAISTYQWEWYDAVNTVWNNATGTGNKTATLKVTASVAFDGRQYRCKVTDANGVSMYSDKAVLNVFGVVKHPENYLGGGVAEFKVEALGAESYQWQYRTFSTGTWQNATADGNKTATLSVSNTASKDEYQYRCKMTAANGTVFYSNAATLVYMKNFTYSAPKTVFYAAVGEKIPFTIEVDGGQAPYTVKWEYNGKTKTVTSNTAGSIVWNKVCEESDFSTNFQVTWISDSAGHGGTVSPTYIDMSVTKYEKLEAGTERINYYFSDSDKSFGYAAPYIEPSLAKRGTNDLSFEWQYAPGTIAMNNIKESDWKALPLNIDYVNNAEDVIVDGAYGVVLPDTGIITLLSYNREVATYGKLKDLMDEKGIWVRCRVKDNIMGTEVYTPVGAIYENKLTATITSSPAASGSMVWQAGSGQSITLYVNVTGGMGSYAYYWDENFLSSDWLKDQGVTRTNSTLTLSSAVIAKLSSGGISFGCEVTDSLGNETDTSKLTCLRWNDK